MFRGSAIFNMNRTAFPEKIKCVLVVAPVNTLKNWEDEFYKWLKGDMEDDIEVYEVSGAKVWAFFLI